MHDRLNDEWLSQFEIVLQIISCTYTHITYSPSHSYSHAGLCNHTPKATVCVKSSHCWVSCCSQRVGKVQQGVNLVLRQMGDLRDQVTSCEGSGDIMWGIR